MGIKFQMRNLMTKGVEEISDENQRMLANAFNTNHKSDVIFYHKSGNDVQKLTVNFGMLDIHKVDNDELRELELVWDPDYNMGFVFASRSNIEDVTRYSDENQRRLVDKFNEALHTRTMIIHKNISGDDSGKIDTHMIDFTLATSQNIRTLHFNRFCIAWW